jgi:predicted HAD superfamily Cof-like phosphohydrolase
MAHIHEWKWVVGSAWFACECGSKCPAIPSMGSEVLEQSPIDHEIVSVEKSIGEEVGTFGHDQSLRDQVIKFHEAFCPDQRTGEGPPSIPSVDTVRLRLRLITEEYFEALSSILPFDLNKMPVDHFNFQRRVHSQLLLARSTIEDAIHHYGGNAVDIAELADALADLDYVVEGTRIAFGIDGKPIADEVHRSNMTKVGGKRREDGKWEKPDSYSPADIKGELKKQGWNSGVPR